MEELQLLIGMVSDLPTMAIWVLLFFFIYKVVVIGSIYSTIKVAISKLHSWATTPKYKLVEIRAELDGIIITGCFPQLKNQIKRLANKGVSTHSDYIHASDIEWLRTAIDEKIEKDNLKKGEKL